MKLISASENIFINQDSICSLTVHFHEHKKTEDLGYGLKSRPKKVGESISIEIHLSDGSKHVLEKQFADDAYDILFPFTEA